MPVAMEAPQVAKEGTVIAEPIRVNAPAAVPSTTPQVSSLATQIYAKQQDIEARERALAGKEASGTSTMAELTAARAKLAMAKENILDFLEAEGINLEDANKLYLERFQSPDYHAKQSEKRIRADMDKRDKEYKDQQEQARANQEFNGYSQVLMKEIIARPDEFELIHHMGRTGSKALNLVQSITQGALQAWRGAYGTWPDPVALATAVEHELRETVGESINSKWLKGKLTPAEKRELKEEIRQAKAEPKAEKTSRSKFRKSSTESPERVKEEEYTDKDAKFQASIKKILQMKGR